MATLQQQAIHWRDRAIARSEAISDAWQVFLAYAGRFAEIVLFLCMVVSLIQMVPTIHLAAWLTGAVLIIQMVTLDIAGFGLNSLAKQVRRVGDEVTAKKAEDTGNFLIIIMIVSLLSVAIKQMFGASAPLVGVIMVYVDYALILTRVVMTVLYGRVIHALRESQQHMQAQDENEQAALREQILQLQTGLQSDRQRLTAEITKLKNEQAENVKELSRLQELLTNARQNGSSLQASMKEMELSWKSKMQAAVKATQQEMEAKIEALSAANTEMKAQMKAPGKTAKQVSSEKFDSRSFVFTCLQEQPDMKLSEIVRKAQMQGQELSEPTISRYRKEYRGSRDESFHESSYESK